MFPYLHKILKSFIAIFLIYILICLLLFFRQENFIFFPSKLSLDYQFSFPWKFEEKFIPVDSDVSVHGILFHADAAKGLVFYLHGNAGAVDSWGYAAEPYLKLNYDVFVLDYRGYGKSGGKIHNEHQFYQDVHKTYENLSSDYEEKNIVVIGYSIGTAAAARLAAKNQPKMLILQAPYYSLKDLMSHIYPFIPKFLLNYQFETYQFVKEVDCPITIFHGDEDEIIYMGSSLKLKEHLKPTDQLVIIPGQGHNGMNENPSYVSGIKTLLSR